MSRSPLLRAAGLGLAALALLARPARAHPLDEYVQAAYFTLAEERVFLDLNLTPGVEIAARMLPRFDPDGDGAISAAEGRAYAAEVLRALTLAVDGRRVPLTLVESEFPPVGEILRGEGTIRLRIAGAPWSDELRGARPGAHRLTFHNAHEPISSAYLVNAYLPDAPFAITAQERDELQHGIRIDYAVVRDGAGAWAWAAAGLLVLAAGGTFWLVRRVAAR